jgi:hypothetical protein
VYRSVVIVALLAVALAAAVLAQPRRSFSNVRLATERDFDGKFHFCRLVYQGSTRSAGGSWRTDWPRADINMSIRLSELTKTRVSFEARGVPNHLLVEPTSDEMFQCPFLLMSAPGASDFSDADAARLRQYLEKGGFLWADDFWGSYQWEQWESQIRKVFPAASHPIVDLPLDHPLLHAQFAVGEIPQISNIGYWMRSGGGTSEQGADSVVPHARYIADARGRVMVLMTHNTDIGDSFEREADDPTYFTNFSVPGYWFGVNALLYAMTH